MKKLFIGLCALLASTASMAASANKMTMVTYFPVKYVAYSQVDVMKQMDVGLTSACQMNLGCTADEGFNTGKSLRVNNLLKIAGGKLELNDAPAIVGSTAIIGSGNATADFDFETNLRVGNYKQGYTLQADNMYLSELNLFGYKFPACSGETMSWQKLKLKNKDEVYLVCGEAEKTTPDTTPKSCPGGYTYEVSTNKCCRSDIPQSYSASYAWGAPSGCTLPDTDTLAYPGLARCTSNCPHSTACVRMVSITNAQFSTGTSEKKTPQVSQLTCYNGRWVYKENGEIYDKLDTLFVSAVIERCPTTCVDPI